MSMYYISNLDDYSPVSIIAMMSLQYIDDLKSGFRAGINSSSS